MLIYNELISLLEGYWKSTDNRRNFFIEFASQNGFDPLVYGNWDKVTKEDIIKQVRKRFFYITDKVITFIF